jgi:hypothetical protein
MTPVRLGSRRLAKGAVSYGTGCNGGAFHFPRIASSFGHYNRMAQANGPAGAGNVET